MVASWLLGIVISRQPQPFSCALATRVLSEAALVLAARASGFRVIGADRLGD